MKKLLLLGLLLTCLTVTMAAQAATKIVVEAEKYVSITPTMVKATSTLASGGAYIWIPLHRPHATTETVSSDTGHATYSVKVPVAGTYRFWGRCNWEDGCGNSFWLFLGGHPAIRLGQDGTYHVWHWVKTQTVQLPAGVVSITIQNCEDGARIDQFLLTTDVNYVPVRAEHATQ